ncbi:hypothetical protein ACFQZF_14970 [Flavobacterium myungsuense]|uniref:Cytochrome c domain-containing protein n=1 Tax=Flavobacterium myungsuense TaxID=651823 RepID=A0ABW3IZL6_9FLAO
MKKIKILSKAILTLVILCFLVANSVTSCDSTSYQDISAVVTDPTYSKNIESVITTKCAGCHSTGGTYPPLENYDQVKEATYDGNLLCRINGVCGKIMPTSGKMPQATIDMIQLWATKDFPK